MVNGNEAEIYFFKFTRKKKRYKIETIEIARTLCIRVDIHVHVDKILFLFSLF